MSPSRRASASGVRAQARTRSPRAAYSLVNSRPRPRLAPVIRTVDMRLLYDAVGGGDQGARQGEAQRLRGPGVEHEAEFRRLLDRQVGGLGASQDAVDIARGLAVEVGYVLAVAHQASVRHVILVNADRRQPVA